MTNHIKPNSSNKISKGIQYKKEMVNGDFEKALEILHFINENHQYDKDIYVCYVELNKPFKAIKYLEPDNEIYNLQLLKCSSIIVKISTAIFIAYVVLIFGLNFLGLINFNSGNYLWLTILLFAMDIVIMNDKKLDFRITKLVSRFF